MSGSVTDVGCRPAPRGYVPEKAVNPVQLEKFLGGVDYPADKQTLIDTARKQGADENVLKTLKNLDRDNFSSPNDVSEAVGP